MASLGVKMNKIIKSIAHKAPSLARLAKRIAVYPRYALQARNCRQGYRQFGQRYAQNLLFIAGLPKSGTTWLEKMVASYPGFHELLIPDVAAYELATGGSHDYDLPTDIFSRFKQMLVVSKMHVHGSPHNVNLLHDANVRYVVLYRDLRDVAISYYFYVRQTPWHPEYPIYASLSLSEGLQTFAERTLLPFAAWVCSWHQNHDPTMSLLLRYEELLEAPINVMTQVAQHFELDSAPETIEKIVQTHRFERLSGGRKQGRQSQNSFFRKGVAGDWQNHLTAETKESYKQLIGEFLIEFGYEDDKSW